MPYVLLVVAAVIVLFGVAKLRGTDQYRTLWRALLMWATLIGVCVLVWVLSLHH